MALGRAQVQQGFDDPRVLLGDRLREGSLYRLLADHGLVMFPDDYFADLYAESARGRPTVPARVMATVMLLQAFEGLSDPSRSRSPRISRGSWNPACTCALPSAITTILPGQGTLRRPRHEPAGPFRTRRRHRARDYFSAVLDALTRAAPVPS